MRAGYLLPTLQAGIAVESTAAAVPTGTRIARDTQPLPHIGTWFSLVHVYRPPSRHLQKYRDAAMIELEALNTLAANDPSQERHCVQLLEWFDYR